VDLNLSHSIQFITNFSIYNIPHPDKVAKGGEDAYYANTHLLAVADGVGGWNNQGVDPSLYSRALCAKYSIHI
jgi:protein phosphatase PTC7